MKRGNARGAKGAGHPRQDGVNGQPDELLVLMEGGSLLLGWHEPDESRGSRPDLWAARGETPRADPAWLRSDNHPWCVQPQNSHEFRRGFVAKRELLTAASL